MNNMKTAIDDSSDDLLMINRGIYDGQADRAWTRITGFVRNPDGLHDRFDETISNTVFDLTRVRDKFLDTGWREIRFVRPEDLRTPLTEPEMEGHVFVVASK